MTYLRLRWIGESFVVYYLVWHGFWIIFQAVHA